MVLFFINVIFPIRPIRSKCYRKKEVLWRLQSTSIAKCGHNNVNFPTTFSLAVVVRKAKIQKKENYLSNVTEVYLIKFANEFCIIKIGHNNLTIKIVYSIILRQFKKKLHNQDEFSVSKIEIPR